MIKHYHRTNLHSTSYPPMAGFNFCTNFYLIVQIYDLSRCAVLFNSTTQMY